MKAISRTAGKFNSILYLASGIFLPLLAHADQSLSPLMVLPNCNQYRYALPTPTQSGEKADGPAGALFCTQKDFPGNLIPDTPLVKLLNEKIADQKIKNIYLSAYTYSEPRFAEWLCSKNFSDGASITILAQKNNAGAGRVSPEFANELDKCPATKHYLYFGCEVFGNDEDHEQPRSNCPRGRVNTLHLKTLQVHFDSARELVLLGSGNYNRSLYANIEDWTVYEGPALGQPFPVTARCMFESAMHNSNKSPSADELSRHWSACMSEWGKLSATEGVILEFAPFQGVQYKERLESALKNAQRISIAAQSLEDPDVINSILANPASDKRIIVDDDWYWAQRKKADFHTASFEGTQWINQLSDDQVRFTQTNHTALGGVGGTLHTRLIITQVSGSPTVFTGSAHIKKGSYELNIEHLLTLSNKEITSYYQAAFDELWNRSLPASRMPTVDTPIILE